MEIKIAGAGLMGRLLGWHYSRLGHMVSIYERAKANDPQSAAFVAASMMAAASECPETDAEITELAQQSNHVWPSWLDELKVPYAMDGTIVLAHPNDHALITKYEQSLKRFGFNTYRKLDSAALQELEPELSQNFLGGIHLTDEGWLDNRALLSNLESKCGEIYYEHSIKDGDLKADLVIDCRGAGSCDPEIRAVRGEIVRIHAPQVSISRPVRVLHPRYRVYVVPRPNYRYVVGATQIESDNGGPVTIRSALELLSAAFVLSDGFGEAEIEELSTGLRPAYPDNCPQVKWRAGMLCVNGSYRHGFAIAPALVQQADHLIEERCKSQ